MPNTTLYELIDRARSLMTYSDIPSERTDAALFLAAVAVLDEQRPGWRDSIELYWPSSSGHRPFHDLAVSLRATVINFTDRKSTDAFCPDSTPDKF